MMKVGLLVSLVFLSMVFCQLWSSSSTSRRQEQHQHTPKNNNNIRRIQKSIDTIGNSGTPPANALPLQECQGDCDKDSDCASGLVCFQRNPRQAVPGCSGGESDRSKGDFCIQASYVNGGGPEPAPPAPAPAPPVPASSPASSLQLQNIGKNGNPSNVYPLLNCQGDCDTDDDCYGDLVCYQRNPNQSVPGCIGGESFSADDDFCVLPNFSGGIIGNGDGLVVPTELTTSGGTPTTTGSFRLKRYWEPGYYWQEESVERRWCAMYRYEGRNIDGNCWYGKELRRCRDDQVYIDRCSDSSRQRFRFLQYDNGEVQIRVAEENRCFETDGYDIYLRTCDSEESRQRFFAPNGDFNGNRFELSQRSMPNQCMTQAHHPKPGEVVEMLSCVNARNRNVQTSYWNRD